MRQDHRKPRFLDADSAVVNVLRGIIDLYVGRVGIDIVASLLDLNELNGGGIDRGAVGRVFPHSKTPSRHMNVIAERAGGTRSDVVVL